MVERPREIILREIQLNPGIHMRELQRRLKMPTGTLTYNLQVLEKEGKIYSRVEGGYRRYYALTLKRESERKIIAVLRLRTPRRILAYLLVNPGASQKEISEYLNISAGTLSYHMKKLVSMNIVEERKEGQIKKYWIKDEYTVKNLLINYRETFLDKIADSLINMLLE